MQYVSNDIDIQDEAADARNILAAQPDVSKLLHVFETDIVDGFQNTASELTKHKRRHW